jgi:hypothetical protein
MGGELVCRSEVGKGSVFQFRLPLSRALNSSPESLAATQPQAACPRLRHDGNNAPVRILLVEGNQVNAIVVAEAELPRLGMQTWCWWIATCPRWTAPKPRG